MHKQKYKKLEATTIRSLCVLCKRRKQRKNCTRTKTTGVERWHALCSLCHKVYAHEDWKERKRKFWDYLNSRPASGKNSYRNFKRNSCEECGFIPEDLCQLDVHHIDKNHLNNDPTNLKTLCANCHRLVHKETP